MVYGQGASGGTFGLRLIGHVDDPIDLFSVLPQCSVIKTPQCQLQLEELVHVRILKGEFSLSRDPATTVTNANHRHCAILIVSSSSCERDHAPSLAWGQLTLKIQSFHDFEFRRC
jgi:hypothetical protein